MGYIREPKNIDLVVGPSVLTEANKKAIARAIAQYKKSGTKPADAKIITQDSVKVSTRIQRVKAETAHPLPTRRKREKI